MATSDLPTISFVGIIERACIDSAGVVRLFLAEKSLTEGTAAALSLATIAVLSVMRNSLAGNRCGGRCGRRRGRGSGRSSVLGRSLSRGLRTAAVAASPDSWAGHGVLLVSTPDAEVERLVVLLVRTRELDGGAGSAATAASNLDLSASVGC
jgi:hypothetical protein